MSRLEVRDAVAADVQQMAAVHVAASRRAYAGLIPDRALDAMTPAERARRWAESVAAGEPDQAILVAQSSGQIVGLGHCGPQRTPALPSSGEFYCVHVLPEAQRRGIGTALMSAMARFLIGREMGAASVWVARDNAPARRFYDRLGGVVWAEQCDVRADFVLAEVAYGWRDLAGLIRSADVKVE
jgi:ribosomal protein S18 acetylase RimI-like enzyme